MFSTVLVANRGEIALRVMRTCRRLGIRTVAVYSDADARAPHVRAADAAVRLGPGPAADSYLRGDLVIAAAHATGAAAIHPGYGFLSENAAFADAVEAAGLAWIGPPAAAMRALGDKARGKALAEANRLPVLPGYHADMAADEDLVRATGDVGYPLLVKASAGGGGRGMRVVRDPGELREAIAAARREANASFGDDRLLLERFVERPRHVEVQVLGDAHGTLVHLGERECSIQRRHQKLVEESPSPAIDATTRAAMGEAALRLARAAGYRNAGTVEFLLDEAGSFFFLEVNARLQVEHPVTEAVTGLDLVEQQLRVAAGERLGFGQDEVAFGGHAIELRVVAEDPSAGFLPSTGTVTELDLPTGVRVDTGIGAGTAISPFYDSLVAKVIAHGRDRAEAIVRLAAALDETRIEGVATNLDLLAAVVDEPAFRAGDLHTGFLDEHRVVARLAEVPPEAVAASAAARALTPASGPDPWSAGRSWRLGGIAEPARLLAGGRTWATGTSRTADGAAQVAVAARDGTGGPPAELIVVRGRGGDPDGGWRLTIGDAEALVRPATGGRRVETVTWAGRRHRIRLAPPPGVEGRSASADVAGALTAPMPGRIVRVHASSGDHVRANEPLLVLEAMKMEHVIAATAPGRVARLLVREGDQVGRGQPLVELEGDADGGRGGHAAGDRAAAG